MNKFFWFFVCVAFIQNMKSQTILKGKIVAETANLENINIINLSNKVSSVSDALGYFDIVAKPQDTLVFSSVNIMGIRVVLKNNDFSNKLFFVRLKTKINHLEDVTINNQINAVSLGIVPKGVKKYTTAERRLKNAGDFKPIHLLGLLGGSVAIEPIINAITGKTDRLKKELIVERKEKLLLKLNDFYTEEYYTNSLKIPKENVKGFQILALDNEKIIQSIMNNNKTMTSFLLTEFSKKHISQNIPKE